MLADSRDDGTEGAIDIRVCVQTEPFVFPSPLLPMLSLSRAAPVRLASRPQLPLSVTRRPAAWSLLFTALCIYLCFLSGSGENESVGEV